LPAFFWIKKDLDGSSIHQFYGLYNEGNPNSIKTFSGKERYGIPSTILPIGDDGIGNYICLGISQKNIGIVYFLDHDQHPYNNPESMDGIFRIANSFTEFLNLLTEAPPE